MSSHDVWQLTFTFFSQEPVCVEPAEENISTDAGLLIFGEWDAKLGLTESLAQQLGEGGGQPAFSSMQYVCGVCIPPVM
jgi:hypothetical protein